jgi:hypothetical protein
LIPFVRSLVLSTGYALTSTLTVQLGGRAYLQTVHHAFDHGIYAREPLATTGRDTPEPPSIETLTFVGRLLFWSTDRDWALIGDFDEKMDLVISNTLSKDKKANELFQISARPLSTDQDAYTWTGAKGRLRLALSDTTTYMKLPNSIHFQRVHRARLLDEHWSNGDCGAVMSDENEGLTFGHVVGGSRASGVAFIVAADQVVKDLEEIDEISRFLEKRNLTHLPHVEERMKAARSHSHGRRLRLTEEESDIDVYRRKYSEALQEAAVDGKTQIVRLLLDTGADDNAQAGPLLLDHGEDINAHGGDYG